MLIDIPYGPFRSKWPTKKWGLPYTLGHYYKGEPVSFY